MDGSSWKAFFTGWSSEMPRRGILVTSFGEQIPFAGFLTSDTLLAIERTTPDSLGARSLVIPYENVSAVKLTDVFKPKAMRAAGFDGPAAKP